jgi:thiamine pyrophosphate-dependent acetolactate synthase large subunit-like protein
VAVTIRRNCDVVSLMEKAFDVCRSGVPGPVFIFRLNYGRSFGSRTKIISINRSKADLRLNCQPDLSVQGDPSIFLCALADVFVSDSSVWEPWIQELKKNDVDRETFIAQMSEGKTEYVNKARRAAKDGHPVFINTLIGKTDFRKGSISM